MPVVVNTDAPQWASQGACDGQRRTVIADHYAFPPYSAGPFGPLSLISSRSEGHACGTHPRFLPIEVTLLCSPAENCSSFALHKKGLSCWKPPATAHTRNQDWHFLSQVGSIHDQMLCYSTQVDFVETCTLLECYFFRLLFTSALYICIQK